MLFIISCKRPYYRTYEKTHNIKNKLFFNIPCEGTSNTIGIILIKNPITAKN